MSTKSYWLSYDARYDRRRPRRKWPWFLFFVVLLLAALLATFAFASRNALSVDLSEPVTIQEALPALLVDHVTVMYVVDDSNSMISKLPSLHQALDEVAHKHTENSELALMRFGTNVEMLFAFTEPSGANWDTAIPSFAADSGKTALYTALIAALDAIPDQPTCVEYRRWLVFQETICRERRIVLMSDGQAGDPHLAADAMRALVLEGIPVDAVAFGEDADREGLRNISSATGGRFVEAH